MHTLEGRLLRGLLFCSHCSCCQRKGGEDPSNVRRRKLSGDADTVCSDSDISDTFVVFEAGGTDGKKSLFPENQLFSSLSSSQKSCDVDSAEAKEARRKESEEMFFEDVTRVLDEFC